MTDWKPIETAPKDRRIMIWDHGYALFARWSDECEHGEFVTGPGWQIFATDDGFYSIGTVSATHWAPEPAPPEGV